MASLGFSNRNETNVNVPRSTRVKNKSHALIQITAEHIIQEARKLQEPENHHHANHKIIDTVELQEYRLRKRNEYENQVRRGNKNVWVKYAKWEESQKDFERARSYGDFEMRNKFLNHARNVFDRAVTLLPRVDKLWSKYIHMEKSLGNVAGAQQIHERWLTWNPDRQACRTEVICKEQHLDRDETEDTIVSEVICKEQHLDRDETEDTIVSKKRFKYEEQSVGNKEMIREVYERAIANVPPAEDKRYWQRYIYLWINYSLYEELCAQDISRTRDIFKKYIEMELRLGNIDRCRKLYEKYLEWSPENCYVWCKYAELERSLSETERARAIFELAIAQAALDMPELLWKEYIDFETAEGEFERTRRLYERLLDRTKHLKVWISYALFEASAFEEVQQQGDVLQEQRQLCVQRVRRVFENAIDYYKTSAPGLKEERAMLLGEWFKIECSFGELGDM
ncbi:crooked neck-like protein 1 [Artemisia annua]|uniref:Crooked neck-like protein 1 n=1 Tax=Artemisia annua TaxID=35608 RepID=A0A2U1L7S5_ARTAN|nr:crooked neck-like protein 1 [Artemisia annua]